MHIEAIQPEFISVTECLNEIRHSHQSNERPQKYCAQSVIQSRDVKEQNRGGVARRSRSGQCECHDVAVARQNRTHKKYVRLRVQREG